jgi:D-amino-acid dehydrogenase
VTQQRITVIGAGIIGLSVAYHLLKESAAVTLVDRNVDSEKTSYGNAGAIAVTEMLPAATPGIAWSVLPWMLDPLGPLSIRPRHAPQLIPWLRRFAASSQPKHSQRISTALAALNTRVYRDLIPLLTDINLTADLHRTGALSVYESAAGYRRDEHAWAAKQSHGVIVEHLTAQQARALEPALAPTIHRAIATPQWSNLSDPKRLVLKLHAWLTQQGVATIPANVIDIRHDHQSTTLQMEGGQQLTSDRTVLCAGAWAATLVEQLGEKILLESERGYNATIPDANVTLQRTLIFPERHFVATPLICGLRIGGAAEFGGLNAAPNYKRSQALLKLATRYLPTLNTNNAIPWAGHRPATPDSLPVIGPSTFNPRILYAFGHGHLGLTHAATTGRLIADICVSKPACLDLSPYAISRFN